MGWKPESIDSKDMAVHAVLLPTGARGRILYFGGYSVDDTHLFDIEEGTKPIVDETKAIVDISAAASPEYNAFCSGHAFLADGRILVAGGQLPHPGAAEDEHEHGGMGGGGERRCSVFMPLLGIWDEICHNAAWRPQPSRGDSAAPVRLGPTEHLSWVTVGTTIEYRWEA